MVTVQPLECHGITFNIIAHNYLKVEVNRMSAASILIQALLSAILLSCVSVHAYGGEPGDIAVPSMSVPNMDMPKPLVSRPNMDMPEPKPKPLVEANNDLNPVLGQAGNISSNQTQGTQIQQEAVPMDVSGKWSIKFDNGTDRSLDLTLWSSAENTRIMGFGTLIEEGKENSVTAAGSVTAQGLKLTAKLATPEYSNLNYDECNLDLFTVNDSLSGTYVLRSGGQFLSEGNATAVKQ
jgi:hypothetical protein